MRQWDRSLGAKKRAARSVTPLILTGKRIADEIQQRGTVDHALVYPREVVKRALELGATA